MSIVKIWSLTPLITLWFGTQILSKIVIVSIICFFPIIINGIRGIESVPIESIELFKSYSANELQIFLKLKFIYSLPYIFQALKISSSLAIIGAIVGEFISGNNGIGFLILYNSYYLKTPIMFSAIFMSTFIGVLFFELINILERKIVFWK